MDKSLYDLAPSREKELLKKTFERIIGSFTSNGSVRRKNIKQMFDFFSGSEYDYAKVRSMVDVNVNDIKHRFSRYNLGRSKLMVLPNEFLGTPLQFSVYTVDRESNLNRLNQFNTLKALATAKPVIDEMREKGYDVFQGMELPDMESVESAGIQGIRLEHEAIMQRFIEEKQLDKQLKEKLLKQVVSVICTGECFAKVEQDVDGKLTVRSISPDRLIAPVSDDDDWGDNLSYIGEHRQMSLTSAKRLFSFSRELEDRIDELTRSNEISSASTTESVVDTYTIQFLNKGYKVYYKTENVDGMVSVSELSEEEYNKNRKRIDKEVANGLYELSFRIVERIYEATYIANGIDEIVSLHIPNCAMSMSSAGHIKPNYDYVLLKTSLANKNGTEPLASIVKKLDEDYDIIRFLINRELKKPQGNIMTYDQAYLPKNVRNYDELRKKISETGEIRYDSSADGNVSQTQGPGNGTGVSSIKVGDISVILEMTNIAMSIEQTLERLTGINESRSGLTKATATATTSNNNLEASRTMTYDVFWNIQRFGQRVITVMCNKLKANPAELDPKYSFSLMDENEYERFISTAGIMMSDFKAFINDGRKDASIIEYMKQTVFSQDIAAGKINSATVAEFLSQNTLPEAISVLKKAEDMFSKMASSSSQAEAQQAQQLEQMKHQNALQIEGVKGQNAIDLANVQHQNALAEIEQAEQLRGQNKQAVEDMKIASNERVAESDAAHRHADVEKNAQVALQKALLDKDKKSEQKASPSPQSKTKK